MAQRLFAMEENNRPANNEERNIFYEYFSRLQLKEDIDITELDKKIKEFHNETLKTFATIIESSDKYENNNESFNRNILHTIVDEYHKFHKNTFENNLSQRFINCILKELTFYSDFFNTYNLGKYSKFGILLRKVNVVTSALKNKTDTHFLGFSFLFSSVNLVDHFFNIIPLVTKKDHRSIYNKGCNVLKLSITKFIEIVLNGANDICNIINGDFSGIAIDIANIVNAYYSSQSNTFTHNYINKNNSTQLSIIRKYLSFAEYAYNDGSAKIPNTYSPITNYSIIDVDKNGYFNFGMMYACLLGYKINNEIIIGFCGTVKGFSTKCLKTVLTDLSQLCDVSTAYIYAVGTVAQIKEDYPNFKIALCGHSLGGGLAQFAAAPHKKDVEAYCYNSAGLVGAYNAIKKFLPVKNIYHYRLENDIISCVGKLIGDVCTIKYPKSCYKSHGIGDIKDAIK